MVWNDMQWYSYSLPFLLMQTFWMDTHRMDPYWWDTCWTDMYWWDMYWWDTFAIPADAHLLNGYALNGYASHGYVLVGYVLKGYVLVGYVLNGYVCKTDANLLNGYALNGYVLVGYVLNGYVLVGYVLVGYVLNGYVWDMCDVLDMCGICVVWDTPTIFWRTLRRNVFREKNDFSKRHHLDKYMYSRPYMLYIYIHIFVYMQDTISSHHKVITVRSERLFGFEIWKVIQRNLVRLGWRERISVFWSLENDPKQGRDTPWKINILNLKMMVWCGWSSLKQLGSMGCIPSNGKFGKSFDSNTHWGGDIWDMWSFEGNIWKPNKIEVWLIQVNFCFPVQCGWFWGEPAGIFFRGVVTSHITHSYWHDLFFLGGGRRVFFDTM